MDSDDLSDDTTTKTKTVKPKKTISKKTNGGKKPGATRRIWPLDQEKEFREETMNGRGPGRAGFWTP